jgi:predicted TIM-barrel fold metal-dependent hydrolase
MNADQPAMCAGPILEVRKPKLTLPPKAADCHCHVFGPPDRYPWAANRLYTPPPVYLEQYLAMLRATGFERGVMVQTGLYGSDNRFIVDAIKENPERLRGIALIGEDISDRALRDLTDAGVRGFRVNRTAKTGLTFDVARRLSERVKDLGWHVQFLLDIEDHPDLDIFLGGFATEVVIDHMGRPDPTKGISAPGFQALIRLLKSGRGWAKLSAPYRHELSGHSLGHSRIDQSARRTPAGFGFRIHFPPADPDGGRSGMATDPAFGALFPAVLPALD